MKRSTEGCTMNKPIALKNLQVQLRGNLYWVMDKVSGVVVGNAYRTRERAEAALASILVK